MNTEPTDDQINRGIAEWMGWKFIPSHDQFIGGITQAVPDVWEDPNGERHLNGPSFTTSHDACHQALERMTEGQVLEYDSHLEEIVGGGLILSYVKQVRASAHQKALAIYRVVKGEGR